MFLKPKKLKAKANNAIIVAIVAVRLCDDSCNAIEQILNRQIIIDVRMLKNTAV